MSDALKLFTRAPIVRPAYNIGCLMDIPTGKYLRGGKGQSILLSGASQINSFCGPGNSYKSEMALQMMATVLGRYKSTNGLFYDTENTMTYSRIERAMHKHFHTREYDMVADAGSDRPKMMFVQGAEMNGDDWFDAMKSLAKERIKNKKSARPTDMLSMPYLDQNGNNIRTMRPFISTIDSLSMFTVSSVHEASVEKNKMGDSANNTMFMKDGAAKTQMFIQLPNMTADADMMINMVAHVGGFIQMDKYATGPATLTFSKRDTKLKGVPEKFTFINNNVYEIQSAGKCIDKTSKAPLYPRVEADRESGNDLMQINSVNTRNKSGPTGVSFNWIVSQKEGVLVTLTEFNYLKSHGSPGWGMTGNNLSYALDLLPDVKMSRTTVRGKCHEDVRLQRAMTITCEMLQMQLLWDMEEKYKIAPLDLYNTLIKKGWDWDMLLNTRGYWVFEEDAPGELPELSTMDMLRMALPEDDVDFYTPYWYKK